jgi:outer membrane receptor protein involved in Fe transport
VPERSVSFDAGVTIGFPLGGEHEADATYYAITTEERILWQPSPSEFDWSPSNLGRTKSTGFEADYRWDLPGRLVGLTGNYNVLNARRDFSSGPTDPTFGKQLIYVPLETGSIAAIVRIPLGDSASPGIRVRVSGEYVGVRYTVDDNSLSLPPYVVLGAHLGIGFLLPEEVRMEVKLELENLTGESYEAIPRYPMPLRHQTLALTLTRTY